MWSHTSPHLNHNIDWPGLIPLISTLFTDVPVTMACAGSNAPYRIRVPVLKYAKTVDNVWKIVATKPIISAIVASHGQAKTAQNR